MPGTVLLRPTVVFHGLYETMELNFEMHGNKTFSRHLLTQDINRLPHTRSISIRAWSLLISVDVFY